ncbi:MAG: uroporphyrinogen-III C-methyltransferase [Pirellulales bacterium]
MPSNSGKVYLVGAGPGDPGLLTLRGAECLREADVVLYDYLAGPELLYSTRADAELVCLGRHGHGRLMPQSEINERMVREARAGKRVVRLKGGDPAIFARLAEELSALEAAGVAYEIVPGVTAAQAASSHAGIPLTNRDDASCVAFVAGQERGDKRSDEELDYAALAQFPGTLVFYMGLTTAPKWSRELMSHGKSAYTPVAIVRRCTFADQQTIFTTLGGVEEHLGPGKLRPPAVVIVGAVARARALDNWFTSRPLFGETVLVTRPAHQADVMVSKLSALGADVLYQPAIEISEPADWGPVDAVIAELADFDWLVFSSSNGVEYFFRRLFALGHDVRAIGSSKLAAIGPATVEALAAYHLTADVSPSAYRAEDLADALAPLAGGKRFFLARASRGREVLAERLTAAGGIVRQAVVYQSADVMTPNSEVVEALEAGKIDWITVTSSAIARSLVNLFGDALRKTKLVAISPVTAEVLHGLGHPAATVAATYTGDGILNAILAAKAD